MEAVLGRSDKTVVEANGVVPYLPLNGAKPIASPAEPVVQAGAGQ